MNSFGLTTSGKNTILIVDDSVENLQLLTALLKDTYNIKVAKNGLKAVELVTKDATIDLVLMDVMMPEMDGYTACQHLKSNELTASVPIIFLTSLNEASDETKGFAIGGADFISKPFNAQVVHARIKTHIDLQIERQKSDALLRYLLPSTVIQELKKTGGYQPVIHEHTSIMFCDMVDYTGITSHLPPTVLVDELTDIFTGFDEVITSNGCMRIKTLGDGYMAASGVGGKVDMQHAEKLVTAGLEIIDFLDKRNSTHEQQWTCRVGIHSGSLISGLVGKTRCQFDVMGDDVNIASRVESNGHPMKLTITEATASLLAPSMFKLEQLGMADLKGKGEMMLIDVSRVSNQ
ncbi:MAG: response regulator [Flavobacteriales bacterium]|nr:response regulator [Flavobacteriales bacterium]